MNNEEIFSSNFQVGNRTYFLDVKKTKDGDQYLKISESMRTGETDFERYQIIVFNEGIDQYAEKIAEVAKQMKLGNKTILSKIKEKYIATPISLGRRKMMTNSNCYIAKENL
jgi:hypothetical protein